tara:strand:- start:127 stop:507 length:381 start_codon:yes stop_codon:yes gene_type:complete
VVDFEIDGGRRIMAELIAQSFDAYRQVKEAGYIVDGKPKFIPLADNSPFPHDEAYSLLKFFFTHSLDIAIAIGGLKIDADPIRSKLEPEIWERLLKQNIVNHKPIELPTKPWRGAYLIVPDCPPEP